MQYKKKKTIEIQIKIHEITEVNENKRYDDEEKMYLLDKKNRLITRMDGLIKSIKKQELKEYMIWYLKFLQLIMKMKMIMS